MGSDRAARVMLGVVIVVIILGLIMTAVPVAPPR